MERINTTQRLRGTEKEIYGVESNKNLVGEEYLDNFSFFDCRKAVTINALLAVF